MRRAWMWGLLLLAMACAEKAPPEGAVRVSVLYGSYRPACVRVAARDDQGHQVSTDLLQREFKDPESRLLRIGVLRQAGWGQALSVEVSSFAGATGEECSGTRVEAFSERVEVPLGDYASVEVVLRATDEDQDGVPALERRVAGLDCDDGRPDVFPGAAERCMVGVDFDCDGFSGCQDARCQQRACDDGDACTTGEVCVGSGTTAQCVGQAVVCPRPEGKCVTGATCSRATGECVSVRKPCPASASICLEEAGVCNDATGSCDYKPKPVTTSCNDGQVCTSGDACDGAGSCKGIQTACTTSSPCFRAIGTCPGAGDCGQEVEPNNVNVACPLAGGGNGVCRVGDGACSRFPYVPRTFDPDTVVPTGPLSTTCAVTFDSTSSTWSPANCITNPPTPVSAPDATTVTFALTSMNLGGELRLVGTRAVHLVVYNSVTLNYALLANAEATVPGAGGNTAPGCSARGGGAGGVGGGSVGGGGGGAGGVSAGGAGESGTVGTTGGSAGLAGGDVVTPLRAGCPGGKGGVDGFGGEGGAGGGAVHLSVAGTLKVNNWVTVSGGGGKGGRYSLTNSGQVGGGGGGGSGGLMLLEAYRLEFTSAARLTANGGGGGEGSGYTAGTQANGDDGEDGPRSSAIQARGGAGRSNAGGDGGDGGALDKAPGNGVKGNDATVGAKGSGGGGGGAAGFIRLRSVKPCTFDSATVISPATDRQCPL